MENTELKKSTGIPLQPARLPFFYGWIILFVGIAGMMMSIPGQTMGVSVFTDDLIKVLGMSRVRLSLAYMIGTVMSALILTPAGRRLDRYGSRAVGSVIVLLLGLVLILMSFLDHITAAAGRFGHPAVSAFVVITIAFFMMRFLGQGMLAMISRTMVMKWFDRQRGMANAVMGIFVSFGFSLAPRLLNGMIEDGGWSGAWRGLGIGMLSVGFVVFLLLSRDNPFECGMKPDSSLKLVSRKKRPAGHPDHDFTLEEARRTLPFWIFGLTLGMQAMFVTAVTFHIVSLFGAAGMDRQMAIGIFLPASIISVAVNFSVSMISDYIKLRYILIMHQAGLMLCMFFFSSLAPGMHYFLVLISYGFISGLFNITTSIVWPRYYGIKHLGAISGMAMGFMVAGSAVGPYFFSMINRFTGSYSAACIISLAVMAVLFVFGFRVKRPVHPSAGASGSSAAGQASD